MNNICYIVGASITDGMYINKNECDFIIAADAGLIALNSLNIKPDLIVGDFDSTGSIPDGNNVIIHPTEKDYTDTYLAFEEGFNRGYRNFIVYGCLGNRLDHSLANIQTCVAFSEKGCNCWLWSDNCVINVISSTFREFEEDCSGIISVFAASIAENVTIYGMKYNVNGLTLSFDMPLGVSNEFVGKKALISVENGSLILMWTETSERLVERVRND